MQSPIDKAISRAKIGMLQMPNTVFLSTICFSLETIVTEKTKTAATDGKRLLINPDFFLGLTEQQRVFLLAHESLHVAYMHMIRLDSRDFKKWNMACDYVINGFLVDLGYSMPAGGLYDPRFKDLSSEVVYTLIEGWQVPPDFEPDLEPNAEDVAEQDVRNIVARASIQAQLAGGAGSIPDEVQRLLEDMLKPRIDWRRALANLLLSMNKADYSYRRFNRRYLADDMYLPTLNNGGELVNIDFAVDVSGSVTPAVCTQFCSEMHSVLQQFSPEQIGVYQFGTDIAKKSVVRSTRDLMKLEFVDGGGTLISPVFREFKKSRAKALVILTDGFIWERDELIKPDNRPIIWCIYDNPEFTCKFGTILHVKFADLH